METTLATANLEKIARESAKQGYFSLWCLINSLGGKTRLVMKVLGKVVSFKFMG